MYEQMMLPVPGTEFNTDILSSIEDDRRKEILETVSTSYTSLLVEDYREGDEGEFFHELFDVAVAETESWLGRNLSDEEKDAAKERVKQDCEQLAEHGYDEPIYETTKEGVIHE